MFKEREGQKRWKRTPDKLSRIMIINNYSSQLFAIHKRRPLVSLCVAWRRVQRRGESAKRRLGGVGTRVKKRTERFC